MPPWVQILQTKLWQFPIIPHPQIEANGTPDNSFYKANVILIEHTESKTASQNLICTWHKISENNEQIKYKYV